MIRKIRQINNKKCISLDVKSLVIKYNMFTDVSVSQSEMNICLLCSSCSLHQNKFPRRQLWKKHQIVEHSNGKKSHGIIGRIEKEYQRKDKCFCKLSSLTC